MKPRNRVFIPVAMGWLILLGTNFARAEGTIAVFRTDVTIPVGHPCMGGGITPALRVIEPLEARGFVLTLPEQPPLVVVCFDWCEIRGSAFDDWRNGLAAEAGTTPERVLVSCTHVHDAPVMDPEAEFLLRETEQSGVWKDLPPPPADAPIQLASVCQPDFNRICIQRTRAALREALKSPRPVTHFGVGRAKVKQIASNRRFTKPNGEVSYGRYSRTGGSSEAAAADEGEIDPWLRTLSFWNGDQPVAALHSYAVHPMSYYGSGEVSIDFVGLARERRQKEQPKVFQIYGTGCAGNVTAGKYNDGRRENRAVLVERLHAAMVEAWEATKKQLLAKVSFHNSQMELGARDTEEHTVAVLRRRLTTNPNPFARAESAMGLAWYARAQTGHKIDLPRLDFGGAHLLLLPAEAYVEFQLYAQEQRPDDFVMCLGYGECGPGYIPIERAWKERDENLRDWAWVGPGSEERVKQALRAVFER